MSGQMHRPDQYCWACLPDKYVAGFERVPKELKFLRSSLPAACPYLSGDAPDDGRMWKPPLFWPEKAQ